MDTNRYQYVVENPDPDDSLEVAYNEGAETVQFRAAKAHLQKLEEDLEHINENMSTFYYIADATKAKVELEAQKLAVKRLIPPELLFQSVDVRPMTNNFQHFVAGINYGESVEGMGRRLTILAAQASEEARQRRNSVRI